jgi:hypothetical protein
MKIIVQCEKYGEVIDCPLFGKVKDCGICTLCEDDLTEE